MSGTPSAINLGPKEKRKRLILGIGVFFLAAALSIYFVFKEISPFFRLSVWPLFFIAILGFLQAKERTCVFLAWKRVQNLDAHEEPPMDCKINDILVVKSQKMIMQAFILSLALTLACFFS